MQLDRVFGALSDPTRRAILERLTLGETPVTELAAPFSSSLPAISKHLRVLEGAGLIFRQSVGRQRICRINPAAMEDAAEWVNHYRSFWTERLDALDEYLKSEQENEG
jgi:DNA-binding transcriptional ArsR family regulator